MKLSLLNTFQKIDTTINYLFGNNFNETKFLKNQFRNKEITFFDIGANLGSEIDFIKKNFKSKIYAFEPDKNNFSYLKKKYSNNSVNLFNIALSNKSGAKTFYSYDVSSQSSFYKPKLYDGFINKIIDSYEIKTEFLDNFLKDNKIEKINYLKIDTQGEDLKVLEGAKEILSKQKIDLIKIEISLSLNWNIEESNEEFLKLFKLLNNSGYKLKTISKIKYNKNQSVNFFDAFFSSNDASN